MEPNPSAEEPLVPSLDGEPELSPYIDSSMLSTFRSCKRKFYFNYIRKLVPVGQSIHLLAGGAFAKAIESARNYQFHPANRGRPVPIPELLDVAIGPYLEAWNKYEPAPEETKNPHNVFHAFEGYLNEYHPFNDPVQPVFRPDGTPATEYTFAIPIEEVRHPVTGEPFIFVGRFDLFGLFNDLMVVLDEKTTSALGPYWLRQWNMRGQFLGYVWACQQLGHRVEHAIIRGVCIQKTQHQYASVPVQYPQHLVNRWYEELLNSLRELVFHFENDLWPYNFADACTSYGGCSYEDLCIAHEPRNWLNNYQINTWSPVQQEGS